jgi:gliding motility-associated-like protein
VGTYSLQVSDAHCIANITGTVSPVFVVPSIAIVDSFLINPATGSAPLTVSVTNTSSGATTYTWTFGNGTGSTLVNPPATSYSVTGTYTVVLYAQNGSCIDSTKKIVTVDVPTNLIIPNIFSPNGDGVNDQFFIITTGINSLTCDIFNRWGELLYTMNAPNQVWDGRTPNGGNAPDGTYFYILQAQGVDGKTYKQNGPLTLVR